MNTSLSVTSNFLHLPSLILSIFGFLIKFTGALSLWGPLIPVESTINILVNTRRAQGAYHRRTQPGVYCVPIKQSASFSFWVPEVVSQERILSPVYL